MNILYISISGNTRAFVKRLEAYAVEQHQLDPKNPLISSKEISENSPFEIESAPFFTFIHQYCLTAKQYSEAFKFPFLADYELRGTAADCERVYHILKENSSN